MSYSYAAGNNLEKALRKIDREDIVNQCVFNVELVTDDMERAVAKVQLDQSGFDALREELGPSRDTTLRRSYSNHDVNDSDFMKVKEPFRYILITFFFCGLMFKHKDIFKFCFKCCT